MSLDGRSTEGLLVRRLLLALALYSVVRVVFLFVHPELFADVSPDAIAAAFVRGLRFDLSALAYTNLPFILLSVAPAAWQSRAWYQRSLATVFVLTNATAAVLMTGDLVYFDFTGSRLTFDLVGMTGEATAQLDQLLWNYAPFTALLLGLLVALVVLYPRARGAALRSRRWWVATASGFAIIGLTVVAARGGLQKKVLKPIHAFVGGEHGTGILALNSVFTLIQSPLTQQVEPVAFFPTDADAEAVLVSSGGIDSRPPVRQNVVLLILESFGTEFWGAAGSTQGLTPFLDSLSAHGQFLLHNFANGRRSIDALPSILLGVPLLMSRSIALSPYQGNQWQGLGHLMEAGGYHTSMFHGAPKGTMYFDAIAQMAGVRDFHPLERYPESLRERDFDGHWGLFDEPYLQHVATELSTLPRPFVSTVFTISTHQPYRVPARYLDSLPAGTEEIHRSVRYVDLALSRFFATARQQPWFDETLFIITGDHTPSDRSPAYDTFLGRYMVPLLLYHPTRPLLTIDPERITQHVDILPTILDYTGVTAGEIPRFGRSGFGPTPGEAILQSNGTYWLVRRDGVVQRDADGTETVFTYAAQATVAAPIPTAAAAERMLASRLQAHVQHFNNSMLQNSFYTVTTPRPAPSRQ
jgi:hypothetical protein